MRHNNILRDFMTRVFDIVLAGAGLLVLFPLMVLIAAAVVLESGRPIFFSQARLGRNGRHFQMYKFRKFGPQEGTSGPPLTMKNDTRMSRVGRVLEATKLDELPQLYNIVRGDMSVVGPRPASLAFADCFTGPYRAVLDYKPGIFGPSQVAFRNEATLYPQGSDPTEFYRQVLFPHKAERDLDYYPHRTLIADINWFIMGVLAVFGLNPKSSQAPSDLSAMSDPRSGSTFSRPAASTATSRPPGNRERGRGILERSKANPLSG